MESTIRVQTLDNAICILFCANVLGEKGMNESILPVSMENS